MVKCALLGCGLFAHDVYARLLKEHGARMHLVAAWSRRAEVSQDFVSKHAPAARASHGDQGLDEIIADPEIKMVMVVLPVQSALEVTLRALRAGKHVVEEKPVGPDMARTLPAIQEYRALRAATPAGQVPVFWGFAENYRYEEVFLQAAHVVASGALGAPVKLDLVADMPMNPANKYHGSAWRRDVSGCPGGQIMESSVHFVAALRLVAGAGGAGEAVRAWAVSQHTRPDLSSPDTLVGTVLFQPPAAATPGLAAPASHTVPASVSISMAASQVKWSLTFVGSEGSLEIVRGGWGGNRAQYSLYVRGSQPGVEHSAQLGFSGTSREMGAFLDLIEAEEKGSAPVPPADQPAHLFCSQAWRVSPEEGARDLALVEALLASAGQGGAAVPVAQVPGPSAFAP